MGSEGRHAVRAEVRIVGDAAEAATDAILIVAPADAAKSADTAVTPDDRGMSAETDLTPCLASRGR